MKPELFLIHGWNMHPGVWDSVAQHLEVDFKITRAVMPGYPASFDCLSHTEHETEAGESPPDSMELVDRVVGEILQQAPPSAIWCGWSLGATLAMAAAERTGRIEQLVLISPTPCFLNQPDWSLGVESSAFDRIMKVTRRRYEAGWAAFFQMQLPGDCDAEWLSSFQQRFSRPRPTQSALDVGYRILCETDLRSRLNRIQIPVTVVAAHEDRVVPPAASCWVAENLSSASLIQFGNGHALPLLASHELAQCLRGVIAQRGQR